MYAYGEGAWHTLALGILAESNNELAFSTDKAGALEVEWTSMISGPSLDILKKYLDQASSESYIPYAGTLSEFITADEADSRYSNLDAFYADHNHYTDNSDKWSRFSEPRVAVVEVDGAGQLTAGAETTFDAFVTFKGEPYASADISQVKYLLFNTAGELVTSGEADAVGEGQYQVTLDAGTTSKLETGANRIEIIVVPSVVRIASFGSFEFVVTK